MEPERWQQIDQLLEVALERPPAERAAFLAAACASDEALRQEVESLLLSDEAAESFIEAPAVALAAEVLAERQARSLTGQQLGHYQILSRLGAGGMGEVYLAQDARLGRKVALKLLPTHFTQHPERARRFEQEARAASALNHPNILTIHEIGKVDSTHYIVTEFIDGQSLRQRMSSKKLTLTEALEIAMQVASALAAAHEAGIVHRDIKPENIMIRHDGIVKVLDFGLAKLTEPKLDVADTEAPTKAMLRTDPGTVMGTVIYMSPEQATGIQVDVRTDIWSLGVVIYEMVAGCLPFEGSTASQVLASILNQKEQPPLARFSREVPAELERIVSKALRKTRDERYQTTKDLLLDLKSLKHELEFEAKLERTSDAKRAVATSSEPRTLETAAEPSILQALSSRLRVHQRGAAIAVAAVLIIAAAASYFYFARSNHAPINSIAILPFVNVSNDPNTEYLSDGITESIISSLSQLPQLRVMARSTVFSYKGKDVDPRKVGNDLGVRAVLMGRVIQQGDNLTIRTELVNVADGTELWGQQYNRKLTDVFALQEEMAKEISEKLRLKLSGAERQQLAKQPTENLKAFQYYMQGRSISQRRTREDLLTAIRYYERAIEEDRNYALAYAGLADAYDNLGARTYIAPLEGRRKAEEAARKALALDENLAEAHAALGEAYTDFAPFNFSLADRELRRATELSPSLAMAHQYLGNSLARQGRLDESLAELLKARELDPLSPIIARTVAIPYYLKRDYVRALELLRQANELGPPLSTTFEIGIYIQNRLFNETFAELEKAKRERKDDPILIYDTGMVYAAQGKRVEALQIIKELEAMSGASLSQTHQIAKIYAALNEKELALTWLERGLAAGAIASFIKDDPVWDTIRSDPRFADLLQRMGITP